MAELPELVGRYEDWLERQPLAERSRREYAKQVALFAAWLQRQEDPARGGEAVADPFARDYAVRDFKRYLKLERRWAPASVNLALAAVDHFYRFIGLGTADVARERLPQAAPRPLDRDQLLAFVRAAERASVRDRAIGLVLAYTGLRLSELVGLDLDDARVSGRKAVLVVRSGKGDVYREVPLNAPARKALDAWLRERPSPAARVCGEPLFVSRAGNPSVSCCTSSASCQADSLVGSVTKAKTSSGGRAISTVVLAMARLYGGPRSARKDAQISARDEPDRAERAPAVATTESARPAENDDARR
jgi:integrase